VEKRLKGGKKWKNASSSLLFSSLLCILAAFGLIFCENSLTAPEDVPLPDDPPAEGVWRVSGEVYAPPDWDPVEAPGLFRIWLHKMLPGLYSYWVYLSPSYIEWIHHYTNPTTSYWTFDISDPETGQPWFVPDPDMWSTPDGDPPVIKTTYVRGYVYEGALPYTLKDEDCSHQPFNPVVWPRPGFKYVFSEPYYWWWSSVSLDVR
jgi:hypothetical protein